MQLRAVPGKGSVPAVAILLGILAALATPQERLEAALRRAVRGEVRLSACVRDLETGAVVFEHDAAAPCIPASTAKLFTAVAALEVLGANFVFETRLRVEEGLLHLEASGDPNISGRFHGGDPTAVFRSWARQLRQAGLLELPRGIVVHNDLFDRQYRHPDWSRYAPGHWYAAPVGALSLNDNCVDMTIRPGRLGEPVVVELSPPTSYVRVDNRTTTVDDAPAPSRRLVWSRLPGSTTIRLAREFPIRGPPETYSVAIDDPTAFFATVLVEVLRAEGIRVAGDVVESHEPAPSGRAVAVHRSELAPTLTVCLKRSQNLYAEVLFKRVGHARRGIGSFETGAAVVAEVARGFGCSSTALVDGSGLSRSNRTTAQDLVTLLVAVDRQPYAELFRSSLAGSGEPEGTLRERLDGPSTRGRVQAKTGTLAGVAALAGYAESLSGRRYAFAFLARGRDAYSGIPDALVEALCHDQPAGPR